MLVFDPPIAFRYNTMSYELLEYGRRLRGTVLPVGTGTDPYGAVDPNALMACMSD